MPKTRTARPRRAALSARSVRRAIGLVLGAERSSAVVSVTFLGPARMQRLNRDHLGHDHPTDVISFALPAPDGSVLGDIYVCAEVAAANAAAHCVPLRQELIRLVIHGTLHLLGYDHPDGDSRSGSAMWRKQERYVARFLQRRKG